jgi:3-oxoadipyl-CoA thiolase
VIDMTTVYICDAVRTPFGRYGGSLAGVRTDDLAAVPISALRERNPGLDISRIDDVIYGCANQAGEDNRNVGRMALLLAGIPKEVPGATVNRLCGSSLEAVIQGARSIVSEEMSLVIAGGVESMSRAPYVMGKADAAFARGIKLEDTTLGWRFVNPKMQQAYGVDAMAETAENVAQECRISRADQDAFAYRSQQRAAAAIAQGHLAEEIVAVVIEQRKGAITVATDEHPRADTTLEALAKLKPIVKADGTVTAGNASGINDGAAAVVLMTEQDAERRGLTPLARIASWATAGVDPAIMGTGPIPSSRKALEKAGWKVGDLDLVEANEAFAAQALAVNKDMGWDPSIVNVNGGAIAIGHPIGASGGRVLVTLLHEMGRRNARKGLATLCIGGGMGIAMCLER